jgi:UPF0755 protein
MKRTIGAMAIIILLVSIAIFSSYNWIEKGAFESTASESNILQNFEIKEGQGVKVIAGNLVSEKLIKNEKFFLYYLWKTKKDAQLQAGIYEISPDMKISQIVDKFTGGKVKIEVLKLTIPEGFTNKKIINLLREKKPSIADEFEAIVQCKCLGSVDCACDKFSKKYDFLTQIPNGVDMEGYLFPDTYFIDKEETGVTLASKFLNNFNKKVDANLRAKINTSEKTLHETITLASIVEREVPTEEDAKMVAGVFQNRLDTGMALESCATLAYFQGVDKRQFSYEDTRIESPYNTYITPGLPPGPISNPGLTSVKATVEPTDSDFFFFLSDFATGETVYSKTLEEHVINKNKHGL